MQFVAWGPSLKLYQLFGITVRLHWTFLFLPFIALWWFAGDLSMWPWALALMGSVFLIILIHEYGHAYMAVKLGAGAHEINLGALGGAAMCGEGRTAMEDMLIAFSGPVINILLGGALLVPIHLSGIDVTPELFNPLQASPGGFWVWLYKANLFLLAFNLLLPVYPLDGGRIFTAMLAMRVGKRRALLISTPIAIVLAFGLLLLAISWTSWLLGAICVLVIIQALQVRSIAQRGMIQEYTGATERGGWESEFTWSPPEPVQEKRPGFFARWSARRKARKRERLAAKERQLKENVDAILDKVKREGMGALSASEKRTLEEASRRLRNG